MYVYFSDLSSMKLSFVQCLEVIWTGSPISAEELSSSMRDIFGSSLVDDPLVRFVAISITFVFSIYWHILGQLSLFSFYISGLLRTFLISHQ